jgi:3-phenylpropionate/cinnamic acid dioxygenase small subunit
MAEPLPLEDVVAIHQLLGLYGHVVDSGDLDRLGEVFTQDAAFDIRAFDQGVHRGMHAIREVFALGSPPHPPAHHTTNYFVYADDGEVHARSKWLTIDRSTGRVRSGDYVDTVVNTADGWRIDNREVVIRYYVGDGVPIPLPGGD